MKSLMQAAWLMTVAVGNLIVLIIAEGHFFEKQVLSSRYVCLIQFGLYYVRSIFISVC